VCAVIYGTIQLVVVGVLSDPGHRTLPLVNVAHFVL